MIVADMTLEYAFKMLPPRIPKAKAPTHEIALKDSAATKTPGRNGRDLHVRMLPPRNQGKQKHAKEFKCQDVAAKKPRQRQHILVRRGRGSKTANCTKHAAARKAG